ncbi:MAG: hypothetical protein A2826_02395 [Candidatus Doudnabacteria bacterium RIFCSPHIGHO2_01_FULL_43_23]|uniref:Uncharacterized protein n=1 Tax=Candidatus Doudnabacteria bacterium RIFCSPHIGHO2_01_FULL_43_23 TaxID=1817822 RepID=A0A1F5NRM0_9BACT|nr:MAG: hypothetical protein A2826_02395 [Candidatus Doudnabacteria bacterium RIFCSPHIGHO2_01_FULL_43_23]
MGDTMKHLITVLVAVMIAVSSAEAQKLRVRSYDPATGQKSGWQRLNDGQQRGFPQVGQSVRPEVAVAQQSGNGSPDALGLRQARVERVENAIPIIVGEAQGMDRVSDFYNQGFFRGSGRFVRIPVFPEYQIYDKYGSMGGVLQRLVADRLHDFGYAPIAPSTGSQSHARAVVNDELSDRQLETTVMREAEYIFVVSYGFLNTGKSGTEIDGRRMSNIANRLIRNGRTGRIIQAVGDNVGSMKIQGKTAGILWVGCYTPDGTLVKKFQGVYEFSWKEYSELQAFGYGRVDSNDPTLTLLAQALVNRAFPGGGQQ